MRVSYVELFIHCKKVFRACGIPYGCADDGAGVVTWSEFVGLEGLHVLQQEIPNMHPPGMESVALLLEDDGLFRFDGYKQSAIILGKLMADYALAMAETRETVRVHMQNTTRSHLLAQPAHYVASRNKGCLINYKTKHGSPMWILSTPEIAYPVFAEGARAEEIMQHNLTAELGQYETANLSSDDFWLVCTTETNLITSCIRNLRQEARYGGFYLTESAKLKATFEKNYNNGLEIDDHIWEQLDQIGSQTLVEATEESRLRGAGEMAP
ncbi:DUF3726 domain-containing protein [Lentibacillus cibarius]|uniref:DUF3726 domain-containing protein n=1 Tax=Lentibacillus cibarius TaxID=2583219 RepID=A0A5S3QIH2_9BACI|nr:DUF3726 domain-containing protein [Lentibacillus cibarius]TMN21618.1 DUF3726 domain-containing protein [Lentibacillus cibarius]